MADQPPIFLVMGVAGSGKSTLAAALAACGGGVFLEADNFHPPANIAKMKSGRSLEDADRVGWLASLNAELRQRAAQDQPVFLACSALKNAYRAQLAEGGLKLTVVFLKASRATIEQRMRSRPDHFMPASLLDSQFSTLEEPGDALILVAEKPLADLVCAVRELFPHLPWR